jgi:hypothetical protein
VPPQIWKFAPDGTSTVFVTASQLYEFIDLAFDRFENFFVSTESNGQYLDTLLKYAPDGPESTFATGLTWPRGLAFDNAGNLFVAQIFTDLPGTAPGNILKFTPAGVMSVFASGIPQPEFLAFPRLLGAPVSPSNNFDAIDASGNPVTERMLNNLLPQ